MWTRRNWMTLAAMSGLAALLVGAYATHGVPDPRARELLKTGGQYEFIHALATIACATLMQVGAARARFAPALFLGGTLLFSGSLYALAFGAPHWIGAVTPIGGLLFLAGWATLAWSARGVDAIARPDAI